MLTLEEPFGEMNLTATSVGVPPDLVLRPSSLSLAAWPPGLGCDQVEFQAVESDPVVDPG